MSKIGQAQNLLSLTGLSLALCQRLTLFESDEAIYSSIDCILEDVSGHLQLDAAALVMRKPHKAEFTSFLHEIHSFGISDEEEKHLSYFLAQSVVPQVVNRSKCMNSPDTRLNILGDMSNGERTRMVSMLCAPMISDGEVIGIFIAFRSEIAAFCADDESFFSSFASVLAEDIENAASYLRFAKDATTGFYNRRVFFESASFEVSRARRYQAPLSSLVIEIENIPSFIDDANKGREQFLKRFAHRVSSEVRQSDIVARASYNSFLFLQPLSTAQNSLEFARRICDHFQSHPISLNESVVPINVSIGISQLSAFDDDAGSMLLRAEAAASAARRKGSNEIVVREARVS